MRPLGIICVTAAAAFAGGCAYNHGHYYPTKIHPEPAAKISRIGVTTRPVAGAYVIDVLKHSPAKAAHVRVGDLIVEFQDKPVGGAPRLNKLLLHAKPGREADLTILRRDRELWRKVQVRALLQGYREGIDVVAPDIGVDTVTARGAYVVGTWDGWPAQEQLGLKPGDILLELDGRPVGGPQGLDRAQSRLKAGFPVAVLYLSHGKLIADEISARTALLDENSNRIEEPAAYKLKIPILFAYKEKKNQGATRTHLAIGNLWFFHLFRYVEKPNKTSVEIGSIPFDWLL